MSLPTFARRANSSSWNEPSTLTRNSAGIRDGIEDPRKCGKMNDGIDATQATARVSLIGVVAVNNRFPTGSRCAFAQPKDCRAQ